MTTTINKISITGSSLNIVYKGGDKPQPSGFCSQYSDGMCGGFKSCNEQYGPNDYNINFTKGYSTITTYDGNTPSACGASLKNTCENDDKYVAAAAPLAWFKKNNSGNCSNGLQCNYSDATLTDNENRSLCFKLSNIDNPSMSTNIIVLDKCDGNCSSTPCTSTCHDIPCGSKSQNCIVSPQKQEMCYDQHQFFYMHYMH